jgi:hypothetical protein
MPALLLFLFSVSVSIGIGMVFLVIKRGRERRPIPVKVTRHASEDHCPYEQACFFRRPGCWLAVKSRSLLAVQSALGLSNAKPCSWSDGLAGEEKLFIAAPVKGWIVVMGSGLPDPGEDVDKCFRFVMDLSRRLGQVQFFSASPVVQHHAWIRADCGRVVRAYAWGGRTLWQQGAVTPAELELGLKSFEYYEAPEKPAFGHPDVLALNTEKVPLLAARWSLDPARVDERSLQEPCGVAGEPSRRY